MIVIGATPWYVVSLCAAAGIGCCAAMIDALEWIMLQQSVEDGLRGRVLGAWNVAIGFGWIVGPLTLGALADATSVTLAFAWPAASSSSLRCGRHDLPRSCARSQACAVRR